MFSGKTAEIGKNEMITQITGHEVVETRAPHAAPADAPEVLRVEDITLPEVVEHASFTLRSGELLGIAGLVGAGRTELM
ncbi:ABC transporter ATP-binding protein, partial [Acinetobacter baumannii]